MKIKTSLGRLKAFLLRTEPAPDSATTVAAPATPPAAELPFDKQRYADVPASALGPSGELPFHERRYADGVHSFEAGDLSSALEAFRDFLRITHQEDLIAPDSQPYGLANIQSYGDFESSFRKLLDQKSKEWQRQKTPYPRFLKRLESTHPAKAAVRDRKMMFLMPQYIMNSKRFAECDFKDHLLDSAANAGAVVDFFPTDRCSYPGGQFDSALARAELEILSARIAAFKPDVIVVDGNYLPSAESLSPAYLDDLKAKLGFKTIVFIGDAWGSHWVPMADSWSEVGDIIFHFAPDTPLATEGRFPEKLWWDAYPVNERAFFPGAEKKLDISFVGTYVSQLRPFWLTVALQVANEHKLKHRLLPHKREAGIALTMEEYAVVLRQSKMVLNFSTRLGPLKMMTGRPWQAVTAGVLLLEEDNVFTPAYFVPFVHYIPFSTRSELAYAIQYFSRNPDSARSIGDAASAFCREHYSSESIWSRLLGVTYAHAGQLAAHVSQSPSAAD